MARRKPQTDESVPTALRAQLELAQPNMHGGIAIFSGAEPAVQDPVQARMDAAVAEHNAKVRAAFNRRTGKHTAFGAG